MKTLDEELRGIQHRLDLFAQCAWAQGLRVVIGTPQGAVEYYNPRQANTPRLQLERIGDLAALPPLDATDSSGEARPV